MNIIKAQALATEFLKALSERERLPLLSDDGGHPMITPMITLYSPVSPKLEPVLACYGSSASWAGCPIHLNGMAYGAALKVTFYTEDDDSESPYILIFSDAMEELATLLRHGNKSIGAVRDFNDKYDSGNKGPNDCSLIHQLYAAMDKLM